MDIDIDRLRIDIEIDYVCRSHSVRNQVFICLHHGLMQIRAAEITAVHEEILISKTLLRHVRASGKTIDAHYRCLGLYIYDFLCHIASQHILDSEFQRLGRTKDIYILSVVRKRESDIRARKGDTDELCDYVLEFHIVRLEELASCRHIVEKIADAEVGSSRSCDLLGGKMLRIRKIDLTADLILFPAGLQGNFGHCRDRSESLTAETECKYVMEILGAAELRGCMSFKTEHSLVRRHSAAVVDDLYQGTAGILDNNRHLVCTRIDGVLHKLLHYGRRSLHDLSRSDHIGNIAW